MTKRQGRPLGAEPAPASTPDIEQQMRDLRLLLSAQQEAMRQLSSRLDGLYGEVVDLTRRYNQMRGQIRNMGQRITTGDIGEGYYYPPGTSSPEEALAKTRHLRTGGK